MPPQHLAMDATLHDLVGPRNETMEFVRAVSSVMWEFQKSHGPVLARLGITGTGKRPNYRLDSAADGTPLEAIDGNTHRPWTPAADFTNPENWSTATMSLEDVRALLGQLRAGS